MTTCAGATYGKVETVTAAEPGPDDTAGPIPQPADHRLLALTVGALIAAVASPPDGLGLWPRPAAPQQ